MKVNSVAFKKKCRFELSPRYELFFGLTHAASKYPASIPGLKAWQNETHSLLSGLDAHLLAGLHFTSVLPSLLPAVNATMKIDAIFEYLKTLESHVFISGFIEGLLHDPEVSVDLADKKIGLEKAINRLAPKKREWLSYIQLYPYDEENDLIRFLEWLIKEGPRAQARLVEIHEDWWNRVFSKFWASMEKSFTASIQTHEQLFQALEFGEFASRALLKIKLDPGESAIEAMRGGYKIACEQIHQVYFMPSVFNSDRLWSALERPNQPKVVYFPYLDLDVISSLGENFDTSKLDPALMCRAMGDPTRFAILTLLSRQPRASVELARKLELTRATISHHVALLREAGIVLDNRTTKQLEVNWNNLSAMSDALVHFLQRTKRQKI